MVQDPSPTISREALNDALSGRYRVERELGIGGMASVYSATDLRHDREVALKVLRPDLANSLGRERFAREILLAARLTHPHILPLYDSGEADGYLFFVMPVMQGQTLRDRLARDGRLPLASAVAIAADVAEALDYAHRNDIVHRDIKPENILLHEGHALVADFGIGKAVSAATVHEPTLTQVGVTVGTPAYMSPEQAAGEALDGRSDLFALGCVMFEMLTGEAAFTAPTAAAVIARRFVHTPPGVATLRPEVPREVSTLVERLLARDAVDRVATGGEAARVLRTPSTPAAVQPRPMSAPANSVAVLPFVNIGADPENEDFSDGLTEEVITDLSRVTALRVTSRTSVMLHRGTVRGIREVGRDLSVRYVLTGSVRRSGRALRITAQLVDAEEDRPLWADKFAGTMDDVFNVQERVSREIVAALGITLHPDEDRRLAARGIASAEAYDLYLAARAEIRRFHMNPEKWVRLLDRAVAIEGAVPMLRGLRLWGHVTYLKGGIGGPVTVTEVEQQARELIADAPDSPWGYAALGYARFESGDMAEAIKNLRATIARDPTDSDARYWISAAFGYAGLLDHAATEAAAMLQVDPLSPITVLAGSVVSFFGGEFDDALARVRVAVQRDPHNYGTRWVVGYLLTLRHEFEAAQREIDWMREVAPAVGYTRQAEALLLAARGEHAQALRAAAAIDLAAADSHLTFHVAEVFAVAGNHERGMEVIELAIERGFVPVDFIVRACPFIAPLRAHPRFAAAEAAARTRSAQVRAAITG